MSSPTGSLHATSTMTLTRPLDGLLVEPNFRQLPISIIVAVSSIVASVLVFTINTFPSFLIGRKRPAPPSRRRR
jgi:hypothetical protein